MFIFMCVGDIWEKTRERWSEKIVPWDVKLMCVCVCSSSSRWRHMTTTSRLKFPIKHTAWKMRCSQLSSSLTTWERKINFLAAKKIFSNNNLCAVWSVWTLSNSLLINWYFIKYPAPLQNKLCLPLSISWEQCWAC